MNKKTWIHLSSHILLSHLNFGSSVPGIQNSVVTNRSHNMAVAILELFFFRDKNFCNYNSNKELELRGKNASKHPFMVWG